MKRGTYLHTAIFTLVLAIVIISFSQVGLAAERLLERNWIYSDQTIHIDSYSYVVQTNIREDSLIIEVNPNDFVTIDKGDCTSVLNTKVCFEDKTFDHKLDKYKFLVATYNLTSDITTKYTYTTPYYNTKDRSYLVGQEFDIEITLENTGDQDAKDIVYFDQLPDAFSIVKCDDCENNFNAIKWTGELGPGEKKTFSVTILPLNTIETEIRAKISYLNIVDSYNETNNYLVEGFGDIKRFNIKNKLETAISFKRQYEVDDFVPLDLSKEDDELLVGETFYVVYTLDNHMLSDDAYNVKNATLQIRLPQTYSYLGTSGIKLINEGNTLHGAESLKKTGLYTYEWNGDLSNKDKYYIVLKLKAKEHSNEQIISTISYNVYNNDDDLHWNVSYEMIKDIKVISHDMHISSLIDEAKTYESEQKAHFRYVLQNSNPEISYKNVEVSFNTTLFDVDPIYIDSIGPEQFVDLYDEYLNLPLFISRDEDIPVNITINYTTEFGEKFNQSYEEKVDVAAVEPLSIKYDFDRSKIYSDEEVIVDVIIENKRHIDINNVTVYDILPDSFELINGTSQRDILLNENSDTTVYTYKFKAPTVKSNSDKSTFETFKLQTYTEYMQGNNTYNTTSEKLVKVYSPDIKINIDKKIIKDFSYFTGQRLVIEYELTNKEDETLTNINLHFPIQAEVDTITKDNSLKYYIPKLQPGESIILPDLEKVIVKEEDNFYLKPTTITYYDERGRYFNHTSKKLKISSIDKDKVKGPLVLLEKKIQSIDNSTDFLVSFIAKNIGDQATSITIDEFNYQSNVDSITFSVCGGCTKEFNYTMTETDLIDMIESDSLEPLVVYYPSEKHLTTTTNTYDAVTEYFIKTRERLPVQEPKRRIEKTTVDKVTAIEEPAPQGIPNTVILAAIIIFIIISVMIIKSVNYHKKPRQISDIIDGLSK